MLEEKLRRGVDDVETELRRHAACDQLLGARVPVPECVPDCLVLGPLCRGPLDGPALLVVHRFLLRRLGTAGGGASYAVTTYTCGTASSITSNVTAKCLPVEAQP